MIRARNTAGLAALGLVAVTVPFLHGQSVSATGPAQAGSSTPSLFGDAPAGASRVAADTRLGTFKRSRYVTFRSGLLTSAKQGEELALPFFDDVNMTATVAHVDKQALFTSWSGPLDTRLGTFVATKSGSIYTVTANTAKGSFTMTRTLDGLYQVEETNPPTLRDNDMVSIPGAPDAATAGAPADGATSLADLRKKKKKARTVKGGDDGSVTDVLVAYTANAAAAYGGVAGINAEAAKNIAYTNASYLNSGIKTTARLVGVVPVSGTEVGGNLSQDLNAFRKKGDGKFDEVFAALKTTHADDSILLEQPYSPGNPFCGLAYRADNQPFKYAFGVVPTGDCTNAYGSFPHELSHNQGNGHDPYQAKIDGADGQYKYSYGYIPSSYQWRTTMAYPTECEDKAGVECNAIFWFSNPDVAYGGLPTGVKGKNDAAKTIDKTRKRVAAHQQSTLYLRGKVAVSPKPVAGRRVHVRFQGWINPGRVKTKIQWYLDGVPIKKAKGRFYKVKGKDKGHVLSAVITGKKKYYAPVAISTKARTVKGGK